ncbi:MAG: T9SS type A sorting domain-containing protein [Paludibacter sp.]
MKPLFYTCLFIIACNWSLPAHSEVWNPNAPANTVVYTDQQKINQRDLATKALSELAKASSSYTFAPGVYRFSNGSRMINLDSRSNFTLNASGCTFIQENLTGELFWIANATNISIIGPLTIESDPLGYSQAKVTAVGSNSISFDVMSGYPTPKSPASSKPGRIMVFDQYGVWKSPSPNSQSPFLTYTAFSGNNQSGTITTSYTGSDIVQVGDYIVIGQGDGFGSIKNVNGITLQDITITTGCTSLISWGLGTGDWHYTRIKAIPKPGTSQLIGGSGPQYTFGVGSNVYFDGCEFNGSTDDNLNVNSKDAAYFEMKNCKWINSTVRVMAQGFRKVSVTNNIFIRIGQGLAITMDPYWDEGNPCYNATITGNTFIQTPYDTNWDYGAIHFGPVSGSYRFTNVNIARNTISNGKGRGIYVNDTDTCTVANNIIRGMTSLSVSLTNCTKITTSTCTPTTLTPYVQINNGTWLQSAKTTLAASEKVVIDPGQGILGGSWSWFGPNGYISSERQIIFDKVQPLQGGEYVVTFINDAGCPNTSTFNLIVTGSSTSVNSPSTAIIDIFPNPAYNFVNVNNAKGAKISIFDSLGKVVLESNCADDLTRIDVTGFINGFYMIQAQKGKEIVIKKLIITK